MSALPTTVRASRIAAMVGLDKRMSPLGLFHEMRGVTGFDDAEPAEGEEEVLDDPILEGHEFEDAVANVVRKKFRLLVMSPDESREMADRLITGHRDRIFSEGAVEGVMEIKNPFTFSPEGYGDPGSDVVPKPHWIQTQVYQGLFARFHDAQSKFGGRQFGLAPYGYLAARLRGGVELFKVGRDEEVYETLQKQCEEFLHRVHENDPPTPRDEQDMRRRWLVDERKTVAVDAGWIANAKQLRELNAQIKVASEAASALKTLLIGAVQDGKWVTFAQNPDAAPIDVATIGSDRLFDAEAFAAAHPDLLARFAKLDRAALKAADKRLYDSFMRVPKNVAEQKRVLRFAKAIDGIAL